MLEKYNLTKSTQILLAQKQLQKSMKNIDVHESFDDLCRRIIPLNVPGKWNVNMTQNAHIFVQNDNHEIPY